MESLDLESPALQQQRFHLHIIFEINAALPLGDSHV